jgi:hypothetical protein
MWKSLLKGMGQMQTPAILFRYAIEHHEEFEACKQVFGESLFTQRVDIFNRLVLGRFSVLPYYDELYKDLEKNDSKLINSPDQHKWIANASWTNYIKETPQTYTDLNFREAEEGPYIVKGRTNSRKLHWNKLMFAPTKRAALDIAGELMADPMISEQGVIYRKYVPLQKLGEGLNGLPFTNEWRFFYLHGKQIAHGKYWLDELDNPNYILPPTLENFADETAAFVKSFVNFFVLDVALTEQGNPILIEINDGQMSGLQDIDPVLFYTRLKEQLYGA